MPKVVGFSGNIARPSRTRFVVERVLGRIADAGIGTTECFDVLDGGPELGRATSRATEHAELERLWAAIETSDALVVGSPVYKGSYSGMMKHVFDLLDMKVLAGRPVILVATARLGDYALMIEHQMRPLFGFFGALTMPACVFACDADFSGGTTLSLGVDGKIDAAVGQLGEVLRR